MLLENAIARLHHNNTSNTANFPALDGLRGLAILLVVFGHYWSIACERLPTRAPVLVWDIDVTSAFMLAGHGVQMFFVMSAFLLYMPFARAPLEANAPARIKKFYRRRFLRIYPAYFVSTLLGVALLVLFGRRLHIEAPSLFNLVSNLAFVQPFTAFLGVGSVGPNILDGTWSLVVEVYFYLLLPVLALFARRTAAFFAFTLLMLSASIAYRLNVYPMVDGLHLSWQQKSIVLLNLFPYLDAFALGMVSARVYVYLSGLAKPVPRLLQAMLVYLPFIGLAYAVSHPFKPVPLGVSVPVFLSDPSFFFNFCVAALIPGMLLGRSWVSRLISLPILRFTGIVSYSVFLTHVSLARFATSPLLESLRITRYEDKLVALVIGTVPAAIALGTVLYVLIERPFLMTGSFAERTAFPAFRLSFLRSRFQAKWVLVFLFCWYAAGNLMLAALTGNKHEVHQFVAADLTDSNWKSGIATDGRKLLVAYDKTLFRSLSRAKSIILENGKTVDIAQVIDTGGQWVHVYVAGSIPEDMAYPHRLLIN